MIGLLAERWDRAEGGLRPMVRVFAPQVYVHGPDGMGERERTVSLTWFRRGLTVKYSRRAYKRDTRRPGGEW